jgi:sensor histidine kinase YesM
MNGFISDLKSNTLVFNTNSKHYTLSHLTVIVSLFVYCGLSTLLSYVLLGMLGNGLMLPVAFLAPAILFYIYTLCEDIVNPLLQKFASYVTSEKIILEESDTVKSDADTSRKD